MSVRISQQHWQQLLAELEQACQQPHVVTYRALIERLQLPVPAMQTLALALEYLAALDAKAQRPLRSALVVSQSASRLPRPGFFECAKALGCHNANGQNADAAWHAAEVTRVFDFDYKAAPL